MCTPGAHIYRAEGGVGEEIGREHLGSDGAFPEKMSLGIEGGGQEWGGVIRGIKCV